MLGPPKAYSKSFIEKYPHNFQCGLIEQRIFILGQFIVQAWKVYCIGVKFSNHYWDFTPLYFECFKESDANTICHYTHSSPCSSRHAKFHEIISLQIHFRPKKYSLEHHFRWTNRPQITTFQWEICYSLEWQLGQNEKYANTHHVYY